MRVDDIVNDFLKENINVKVIKDDTRSDLSVYNSLRKYIKLHNLRLSVHLKGGKIELKRNEPIGKDTAVRH